jgi:AcrR family transcriptional regulator
LETRQKLIDATLRLLGERSLLDISVAEIARSCEIVPSLFYHYFKDVEDVTLQIAREAAEETSAMVGLIGDSLDGEVGLRRARDLVEAYIAHWQRFRGILLYRNQAADRGEPKFHRVRRDALGPLIATLRRLIERAQTKGRVSKDVHPYLAASGLVSILESLAAHADKLRHFDASQPQLVDTCARMIHDTVTGGHARESVRRG